MKKKLIIWGVFVFIIILGIIIGDVSIQMGTYSPQASKKAIQIQLNKLQNIS